MFEIKTVDLDEAYRIRAQAERARSEFIGAAVRKGARAVFHYVGVLAQIFAEARRQHALYDELSRMTDVELRDIGLSRSDIPAAVAGTLTRDTSRRERHVAASNESNAPAVSPQTSERIAA